MKADVSLPTGRTRRRGVMSRQDLVDAYVSGQVGRRAFVRGLVALGVSASAAAAYADALKPSETEAADLQDLYVPIGILQCVAGGFKRFGFKNLTQCMRAVLSRHKSAAKRVGVQSAGGSRRGKKRRGKGKGKGRK
jgi:hypothetical protein